MVLEEGKRNDDGGVLGIFVVLLRFEIAERRVQSCRIWHDLVPSVDETLLEQL